MQHKVRTSVGRLGSPERFAQVVSGMMGGWCCVWRPSVRVRVQA